MGFLISTIFLLIALYESVAIKIPQKDAPTSSSHMQIFDINLNQTERVRRLIPYMNFYVPANDYLPENEAYSYNPMNGQKQVVSLYQQQQIPHKQSTIQTPQQPRIQPQQQQFNRAAAYNSINKYANHRLQPQTVIYNTRHQPNKPFESLIQQTPQRVNYNYAKKQPLTPFLATNQVPGDFHPIVYDEIQNSYKDQADKSVQIVESQPVQYYDDNEQEFLPKHQSQQPKQHAPTVAQQFKNQRLPEPQLRQYYRFEDPQHQRQNAEIQHTQQQQQPQLNIQHQNLHAQPIHVESSTTQIPRQESPNYVTYLQPQNFVQFIKSTTAKPPAVNNENNILYKIIRPKPTPDNHFVVYQHSDEQKESEQPKKHFRVAVVPDTKRIHPIPAPNNDQGYPDSNDENKQQSQQDPRAPIFRIQSDKQPNHLRQFYSLDPNDGYGSRIPYREQLIQGNVNPHHIPKKQYISSHNPASTTPVPLVSTTTQKYYPVQENEDDDSNYQDVSDEPQFRPTIPTSTIPLHHHQHLTETSQINTPTSATYHPSVLPPRYYRPYSIQPKVKFIPRYQSPTTDSPVQTTYVPKLEVSTQPPTKEVSSTSLSEVLRKLQETNLLPQTLNADNIDDSIQTLVRILNNLKESQHVAEIPSQHHHDHDDYPQQGEDEVVLNQHDYDDASEKPNNKVIGSSVESPGPNTGRPGIDYPALSEIPQTNFNCKEQRYKGFFGDPETHCQVWHYCDLNGGQASFLCPNGTIFSQVALTCDWWFNVKCSTTTQLYVLNERLYKYILPFSPKFPEDYSGPVVDKYLAIKYQEMEEKMRKQKQKGKQNVKQVSPQINKEVHRDDEIEANPTYSNDAQLDDEGQSHNIDNAIQYPAYRIESTSLAVPNNRYSSTTEFVIPKGRAFTTNTTPRAKVEVESEKVEVIEIKSDGSTGHLIPDNYGN